MGMSPEQARRWAQTRQKGRTRFVWLIGVLGWGLAMGLCFPVAVAAVGSFLPDNIMPGWERLPVLLAWSLIICPIAGYFVGLCCWQAAESQYARATQLDRTEQALDRAEGLLERWEKVTPREGISDNRPAAEPAAAPDPAA